MGIKITDRTELFIKKNDDNIDIVLNSMAIDIERLAKVVVPFGTGQLRASIQHYRKAPKSYFIIANKEYAAYQERGKRRDGSRIVRRYSKSGTGKEYLSGPGRKIGVDFGRRMKAIAGRVSI